jgi:hypothetical protein
MYVKVYSRHHGQWNAEFVIDMTKTELKRYKRDYPRRLCLVVTGTEAHRWVRSGAPHGTKLYVDQDKRIRRAGE